MVEFSVRKTFCRRSLHRSRFVIVRDKAVALRFMTHFLDCAGLSIIMYEEKDGQIIKKKKWTP